MIRSICRDQFVLRQKAKPADENDKQIASDLLDTLQANLDRCVGMAANMIGIPKAIIAVAAGPVQFVMINPKIIKKTGKYNAEESCLSLDGARPCIRYREIEVEYQDMNFAFQRGKYSGFVAQIIQHECDHLDGIII